MRARIVDKEVAVDAVVEIEGKLTDDAKALVEQAICTAYNQYPVTTGPGFLVEWSEQEITRDTTRNGRRLIRVDYKDRNTMPLYVTITENK
ncbi:MAG: hypothetical protein ABSE73_08215 [Planctomycetota bacterium]